MRYNSLGKYSPVVLPFRAFCQGAVNIDHALVLGVDGSGLRTIVILMRRHKDDRQLMPRYRKFDQRNRQANDDLPLAEIADRDLHGVDIRARIDMIVLTVGNLLDIHVRCNLTRSVHIRINGVKISIN